MSDIVFILGLLFGDSSVESSFFNLKYISFLVKQYFTLSNKGSSTFVGERSLEDALEIDLLVGRVLLGVFDNFFLGDEEPLIGEPFV